MVFLVHLSLDHFYALEGIKLSFLELKNIIFNKEFDDFFLFFFFFCFKLKVQAKFFCKLILKGCKKVNIYRLMEVLNLKVGLFKYFIVQSIEVIRNRLSSLGLIGQGALCTFSLTSSNICSTI